MEKLATIFNFDNIGSKIKLLAKWSCWITILLMLIAAPILLIVILIEDPVFFWVPLVSVLVGTVIVWIGYWAMYAFGELVENIEIVKDHIRELQHNVHVLAEPALCASAEKARQEEAERARLEEERRARRETDRKAREVAEEAKQKAAASVEPNVGVITNVQMPVKREKTLSEKLAYALNFQTDSGMISYLQTIPDDSVQSILQAPEASIREQIQQLQKQL